MSLLIAFITGLTAGGLGCLAVQGGLLARSLARNPETGGSSAAMGAPNRPGSALPIIQFLAAKWIAYAALGALLGALGSAFRMTPTARAALTVAVGVFLMGSGLRMLGIHRVFGRFIFGVPSAVTSFIRRAERRGSFLGSPLFLGAFTVLLPCGVAQAMMATALATGSAVQGAAVLAAFTLGTFPVFFSAAYFAARLGTRIEGHFTHFAALVLLAFGAVSITFGLNLAGLPVGLPESMEKAFFSDVPSASAHEAATVTVSPAGYTPRTLHLPAERTVTVVWSTRGFNGCARAVVIPALQYETVLPETGDVALRVAPQPKGTVIRYSCAMGRNTGRFVFNR